MKFYFWLMRVLGTPLNSELQADASVAFVLFPALSVTCSRVSLLCGPLTPSKPNPPPPLTAVHLCFLDFPARSPCSVPAQPWILPHWSSFLAHTSWGLIHRLQTLWHLMCFQTCCSESWSSWKSGSVSKETASAILTVSHLRTTGGGGGREDSWLPLDSTGQSLVAGFLLSCERTFPFEAQVSRWASLSFSEWPTHWSAGAHLPYSLETEMELTPPVKEAAQHNQRYFEVL